MSTSNVSLMYIITNNVMSIARHPSSKVHRLLNDFYTLGLQVHNNTAACLQGVLVVFVTHTRW